MMRGRILVTAGIVMCFGSLVSNREITETEKKENEKYLEVLTMFDNCLHAVNDIIYRDNKTIANKIEKLWDPYEGTIQVLMEDVGDASTGELSSFITLGEKKLRKLLWDVRDAYLKFREDTKEDMVKLSPAATEKFNTAFDSSLKVMTGKIEEFVKMVFP